MTSPDNHTNDEYINIDVTLDYTTATYIHKLSDMSGVSSSNVASVILAQSLINDPNFTTKPEKVLLQEDKNEDLSSQ